MPFALVALLGMACSTPGANVAGGRPPAAATATPAPPVAAPTPPPSDMYLDASQTEGARYCLNPESRALREALTRPQGKEDDRVDARALADDVEFFHAFFRKQYAGYPELALHSTFDVEGFFADWAARLRAGPAHVTLRQGLFEPNIALRRAIADRHLFVAGMGRAIHSAPELQVFEYQAPWQAEQAPSSCRAAEGSLEPETLRAVPLLRAGGGRERVLVATARGAGDELRLACDGGRTFVLGKRPVPERPAPREGAPTYEWREVAGAAVITIRAFGGPPEAMRQLRQFVDDYEKHRARRLIVFDLRDNDGGDDAYVYDWVSKLHSGRWASGAELDVEGALFPCYKWNALVGGQISQGRVDEPGARAEREKARAAWPRGPRRARHVFNDGLVDDKAQRPYRGAVVALVNRRSISSGESSAHALRNALGAKIVGERTGGFLTYGNVTRIVFPRTGYGWVVATKRNYFGQNVEEIGLPVDAYLDRVDAPVEEIVPLLRSLR